VTDRCLWSLAIHDIGKAARHLPSRNTTIVGVWPPNDILNGFQRATTRMQLNAVMNRASISKQRLRCSVRGMSSYGTSMLSPADASQNSFSQGTLVLPRLLRPCLSAEIATYQPQPSVDLPPPFHALYYHLTRRSFRDAPQITWISSRHKYDQTPALQAFRWRTHDLVTYSYITSTPRYGLSSYRHLFITHP
jgi:hypothetical protein